MNKKSQSAKKLDSHVQSLDAISERIARYRGLGLSWRKIAALPEFGGSSAGMLLNIHKGYEPVTIETRKRLGLPPLAVEIEPCETCGKAHRVPFCTDEYGEPTKPSPPPPTRPKTERRPARTRIAADVTEEQRKALHGWAGKWGMSWSEFCRDVANTVMSYGHLVDLDEEE